MRTKFLGLVCLVWAGCKGKGEEEGEGGWPRACDQSAGDGDCVLYTGADWEPEDMLESCPEEDIAEACPEGAVVGYCTVDAGTGFETVTAFYTPFWTAPQGVQGCQGKGGSWEAI